MCASGFSVYYDLRSSHCLDNELGQNRSLLFQNEGELRETSRLLVVVVAGFKRSAYYVHATEETYTVTLLNLAKLTKEPSATYQIHLWSQKRHNGQQATHRGDILLRSPLWFRNRYDKFKLTRETPSAVHT